MYADAGTNSRTGSLDTDTKVNHRHRILICGNYGKETYRVNGQTIKTHALTDAVRSAIGAAAVDVLDTAGALSNPFRFYSEARRRFAWCTHLVILPGRRALRVLLPLFLKWARVQPKEIRYVVIGGWLPSLLASKPALAGQCKRLAGIYVETHAMVTALEKRGLHNAQVLPNFRTFDRGMRRHFSPSTLPLKLVFCARVLKEKGIEDAIAAVSKVNEGRDSPKASLDIYGPVDQAYRKRFEDLLADTPHVRYKGILAGEGLYRALQSYDLMLFPTRYIDEGFPGTILDAYIAGVPVIASEWRYSREFVNEGVTGSVCAVGSVMSLVRTIERYVHSPELIDGMRENCVAVAQQYHSEVALRVLLSSLSGEEQAHDKPPPTGEPSRTDGIV